MKPKIIEEMEKETVEFFRGSDYNVFIMFPFFYFSEETFVKSRVLYTNSSSGVVECIFYKLVSCSFNHDILFCKGGECIKVSEVFISGPCHESSSMYISYSFNFYERDFSFRYFFFDTRNCFGDFYSFAGILRAIFSIFDAFIFKREKIEGIILNFLLER